MVEGEAKIVHWMNGWLDCWMIGSMEVDTINPFIHQSINPDASAPCRVLALFISERLHWIDPPGAPGRKVAGQESDKGQ